MESNEPNHVRMSPLDRLLSQVDAVLDEHEAQRIEANRLLPNPIPRGELSERMRQRRSERPSVSESPLSAPPAGPPSGSTP